jgi:hypothetical protein
MLEAVFHCDVARLETPNSFKKIWEIQFRKISVGMCQNSEI